MENNEVLNQIIQILLPILATFLTAVFTYIGNRIKDAYQEKANNETAKQITKDVVQFVEQVYKDLDGPEKLEKAIQQASAILASKGITISEAEIYMLIESAVYGLNEGLKQPKVIVNADTQVVETEGVSETKSTKKTTKKKLEE